jgi:gamma-glutamyltranspeptidase / glutathione hydrolase
MRARARRSSLPFVFPALAALALGGCAPDGGGDGAEGAAGPPDELARVEAALVAGLRTPVRPEVSGLHGAVVSGHPLASAAGYEVLRGGGNAVDAAVTMAAVLAVVRPHMNGVGGDAFALIQPGGEGTVHALNGSGRAGALAIPEFFAERELERIPGSGPLTVTVPGAVSAWATALERFGTIPLARALEPAIRLAEEGFVVTPTLAEDLADVRRLNAAGRALYAPEGRPIRPGDLLRNPALARTLRQIAAEGPGALYGGRVGAALATFLEEEGSPLRLEDFRLHAPEWTESASVPFLGRTLHVVPPNSQGVVLLQMLGIVEARLGTGAAAAAGAEDPDGIPQALSADVLHDLIEARKLAFADRDRWVADPAAHPAPLAELLDPGYLARRAGEIEAEAGLEREPGFGDPVGGGEPAEGDGDTVYLMAVGPDGTAVSWIQSLFSSFGSGLVEPETGIVLQNRGSGFTLEEGHPNQVAPGKRPFHTLMATLVTDAGGRFEAAVGTPGGHGQPQTVAQGILNLFLSELGPQAAVEAPRFRSETDRVVLVEDRLPLAVRDALAARGHELRVRSGWTAPFGNLQVILRTPGGVLRTGADMRREGAALAW